MQCVYQSMPIVYSINGSAKSQGHERMAVCKADTTAPGFRLGSLCPRAFRPSATILRTFSLPTGVIPKHCTHHVTIAAARNPTLNRLSLIAPFLLTQVVKEWLGGSSRLRQLLKTACQNTIEHCSRIAFYAL